MLTKIKRVLKTLTPGKGFGGVFMLLILAFAACTIQKTGTDTPTLTGKWQLKETLADIGDGKAKWAAVNKDSLLTSEFKTDGSITGNAMPGTTRYAITDSMHLAMTIEHNTAPIDYRYKVTNDTLVLNPPCREPCGMKFIRLK